MQQFLTFYYAYVFLFNFIFGYAVYAAFFSLRGLSAAEIGLALAFWAGAAMAFEMPSGALSNRFDRRWQLVAAPAVKGVCFLIWAAAEITLASVCLGFFFWAAGGALKSGTNEAMLFERLKVLKLTARYEKLTGREKVFENAGNMFGIILGGFIGYYSMEMAFYFSLLSLAGASVSAFFLIDIRQTYKSGLCTGFLTRTPYFQNFKNAMREFSLSGDLLDSVVTRYWPKARYI